MPNGKHHLNTAFKHSSSDTVAVMRIVLLNTPPEYCLQYYQIRKKGIVYNDTVLKSIKQKCWLRV